MPSPDKSYNDEMQQWMARQSLWYRLFHDRRGIPRWGKAGLMIPLVGISGLLIGSFAYYVLLVNYFDSRAFRLLVEQELAKALGASHVEAVTGSWKGGVLSVTGVKGEGLPESWMNSFEARSASINLPLLRTLKPDWSAHELKIEGLEVEIRSGVLTPDEAGVLQEAQARRKQARMLDRVDVGPYSGRWGVKPDGARSDVRRITAREATFRWGTGSPAAGQLEGTDFTAIAYAESWSLGFRGGRLSQGWLRGLDLDRAQGQIERGRLVIRDGVASMPPGEGARVDEAEPGKMAFEFGVVLGEERPEAELNWEIERALVNSLLPERFHGLFSGFVSGRVRMAGRLNDAAGLPTSGEFQLHEGFAFAARAEERIALLQVFATRLPDLQIPYLEVVTGSAQVTVEPGRFVLESLDWRSSRGVRMQAQFEVGRPDDGVKGFWRIGLPEAQLARHPILLEQVFLERRSGLLWAALPLEGPVNRCTDAAAAAVRGLLGDP